MLILDALDRSLIHALRIDARAPFSAIADALGSSTQTVARRFRRLRAHAGLRVVGLPNPSQTRRQQWVVRLTASSKATKEIGRALARRGDTSWVRLTSGGTEIVAIIETPHTGGEPHALLLRDLPRTTGITAVSAHYLLHTYRGGPTAWRGHLNALTETQQRQLEGPSTAHPRESPVALTERDHQLLSVLAHDGRASFTELAAATGWSASTVTRRVEELRAQHALFLDVEIDSSMFGITTTALLWMSVAPAHLEQVANSLAEHDELAVVAATTGPTNLLANALCQDPEELHRYLTTRLAHESITKIETAPVLRTLKAVAPRTPT